MIAEPLQLIYEMVFLTEASLRRIDKRTEVDPLERKLEKALTKAFRKEGKLFLERLEELRGFFPEEEVKEAKLPPWYTWAQIQMILMGVQADTFLAFQVPIDAAVIAALVSGGYHTWATIGIEPTFTLAASPEAISWLQGYGAKMVAGIDKTTEKYIHTQVNRALEEGWSYNRTAKAITDRYEQFAIGKPQLHIESRAHLIAVTEVGNAYEEGSWQVAQGMQQAGLAMEKYWSNVGDDRVSDGCLGNTAVGWIPLNDRFPNGPGDMRPLRFPGCRCSAHYRRIGAVA